jgi:hypothetical protein
MRFGELSIVSINIICYLLCFKKKNRSRWISGTGILAVLIILFQLCFEQYRWQMLPGYCIGGLFFLYGLFVFFRQKKAVKRRKAPVPFLIFGNGVIVLGLSVSVLLPALFPVFSFPVPAGNFSVGTKVLSFRDNTREEMMTDKPGDKREIPVKVWYPAQPVNHENKNQGGKTQRASYWKNSRVTAPLLSEFLGLPSFMFQYVKFITTNSHEDVPMADSDKPFPILIFSSGYLGLIGQNTILFEELASFGYIVCSVAHPYENLLVEYPDNRLIPYNKQRSAVFFASMEKESALCKEYLNTGDIEKKRKLMIASLEINPTANESVHTWASDMVFAYNELIKLNENKDSFSYHKIDFSKSGILGMSLGGAAAAQVCLNDSRFKICMNLDGRMYGDYLKYQIKTPFVMMYSEENQGINDFIFDIKDKASFTDVPYYRIVIKGSTHFNYTDFTIMSPVYKALGALGPIDSHRMYTDMNSTIRLFLDSYLKQEVKENEINLSLSNYREIDSRVIK